MRTSRAWGLISAGLVALLVASPLDAQDMAAANPPALMPAADQGPAADAAQALASMLDGAGGGVTVADQINALQDAAAAGDTVAQWQLGLMYENGEGVARDRAKAFGYFSDIANQHADAAPKSANADIVARSFLKMGQYYKDGVPEAGIPKDEDYSVKLIQQAAMVFGDADAQYQLGQLYLDENGLGVNPLQSARWFYKAAQKGHVAAQAKLGDMLFNGDGDVKADPVKGLMWLTIASRAAVQTTDAQWIDDLLNADMSLATPDEREQATDGADALQATLPTL